jgi:TRAP-type uncharacterized transport system substrate-binding protein
MGEPVNFGPRGSGSEVTALRLFNRSRIPVRQTSFAHDIALEKLKAGEIAGMIYVAGKPIPLLQRIEVRDGLRLLPLPVIDDDGLTRAATLTETDYPALVFGSRAVDTLAVPSVLAAYNWPADNERFQPIATFVDHLLARLDQLQASPRHPKWQEVDPSFNLVSWQRHPTVEAYLKQAGAVNKLIGQGGPLVAPVRAAGKAPATAVTGPETVRQKQEPPVDATTSHHRRPVF